MKLTLYILVVMFLLGCETTYVSNNEKYCLDERGTYIECGLIHLKDDQSTFRREQIIPSQSKQFVPSEHYVYLKDYAEQLAFDLYNNLTSFSTSGPIAVTSFVQLDSTLDNTNALGNQLTELLMTELQNLGVSVVDHKVTSQIRVTPDGDLSMSRDLAQLNIEQAISFVLTGTMIKNSNGVLINARVVSIKGNHVVASSSKMLPNWLVAGMH